MESLECRVCVQKYKKKSPRITCENCRFESCYTCNYTFLSNRPAGQRSNIPCMNCRQDASVSFIENHFPKSFMKIWKNWKSEEWIAYEMSLLPDTQKKIEFQNQYSILEQEVQGYDQEIAQLMRKIRDLKVMKLVTQARMQEAKQHYEASQSRPSSLSAPRSCPSNRCRGFLNDSWQCTLCRSETCRDCLTEKGPLHQCLPENLDSVRYLTQETKACPNCTTPISKSEGCDQIWCVHCHTAFHWQTRKIIVFAMESFHNPHYSEWYKETLNNQRLLSNSIDVFAPIFYEKYLKLLADSFHRSFLNDERMVKLKNRYFLILNGYKQMMRQHWKNQQTHTPFSRNESLRMDYLNQKIDLETLTVRLKRRMKSQCQHQEKVKQFLESMERAKEKLYHFYQQMYDIINKSVLEHRRRTRFEVLKEQCSLLTTISNLYDVFESELKEVGPGREIFFYRLLN